MGTSSYSWVARPIPRFAHMAFTATSAGKVQVRSTRTVTRFWSSRVDDVGIPPSKDVFEGIKVHETGQVLKRTILLG